MDGEGGRHGEEAGRLPARGPGQAAQDRGPDLSSPVRRGMVDGRPVARVPDGGLRETRRAAPVGEIHRVHDADGPEADARPAVPRARLALYRRSSDGRGDASADAVRYGRVWRGPA